MTDYRAMCAELLAWAERTSSHYYKQADVIVRARALLANSDGPAVSDDREPASVKDQPIAEHREASAELIRMVINQALRDTASVHWRVVDVDGTQVVRVRDLLAWAERR